MTLPRELRSHAQSTHCPHKKNKEIHPVRMPFARPFSTFPSKASRSFVCTLATVLLASTFSPAEVRADQARYSPLDVSVIELTKLIPPSESVTAYTAPSDSAILLTRFCGDRCVSCEGKSLDARAFHTGQTPCIRYQPGIELPAGESVRCTNRCTTMNAALFSGVRRP